ncbi:MAG: acetate/propionate family kinase [Fuerstiella sp.]|nr:acetate/propionate family kinase [Fuerstiella sp.]MCP4505185.1 acetate/propionate family kinase [Fuerstiella sp.]MDG2131225.1 acetate/propionate family kinase [Fuerstiella sp.]
MKVLVANLGSTSFKYRLFDLSDETQLARGGIDRIGEAESHCAVEIGDHRGETQQNIPDHAAAVGICLQQLTDPEYGCLKSVDEVAGIGFKAVFAGSLSGVRIVNAELLEKMEVLSDIAPAHNPPYVSAMRQLRQAFPQIPLVAALETGFHETVPFEHRAYAVPYEWYTDHEIRRWGFHGASHRFIAGRVSEIVGRDDLKVISCHLGGSASICAIRHGKSQAASMGMSPQGGLPNNNRVGDFDAYAIPVIMKATGLTFEEVLQEMSSKGGLLGISGLSGDCRDLEDAAAEGHDRAEKALRLFEASIRSYVGSYMALLGGVDMIVFTGGIGENSKRIRTNVCRDMEWAGVKLCSEKNSSMARGSEVCINAEDSGVQVWVIPTNEELVVARQTAAAIS